MDGVPAAERPARTCVLLLFIAALAVLAGMIGGDVLWSATAVVLLFSTLNRWFLPTSYRVNGERLEAAYPLRRRSVRWVEARRLAIDPAGGWLSVRRGGSRFDVRSGLDLYWGRQPEDTMNAVAEAAKSTLRQGDTDRNRPITDAAVGGRMTEERSVFKRLKHAFAIEDAAAFQPTEREHETAEKLCREVVRRRMTVPALMLLEMSRPLNYLGAQALHFFHALRHRSWWMAGRLGGRSPAFVERREDRSSTSDPDDRGSPRRTGPRPRNRRSGAGGRFPRPGGTEGGESSGSANRPPTDPDAVEPVIAGRRLISRRDAPDSKSGSDTLHRCRNSRESVLKASAKLREDDFATQKQSFHSRMHSEPEPHALDP